MKYLTTLALAVTLALAGCGSGNEEKTMTDADQPDADQPDADQPDADQPDADPAGTAGTAGTGREDTSTNLGSVAEAYVKLVLAVGRHDADYVDAYYGSEAWKAEVEAQALSLETIRGRAADLVSSLASFADDGQASEPAGDQLLEPRRRYLKRQLEALSARVDMLGGTKMSFDQEAEALYDASPPKYGEEHFQATLDELAAVLAAEGFSQGSLIERYEAFRGDFAIPPAKLDAVFRRAIDDCRKRTRAHLALPPGDSFRLSYVKDKPWSGYNWYQGRYQSLIQVNTDLPIYIDRAVDLACHEGYPGHHVYNALLEKHLVHDRGWVEYSIYPLFSPQSLIAEGTANFGIEMAFPGAERLAYEREVLYPLAGLDASRAHSYQRAVELTDRLSYAGNEAARRYLDGEIDAEQAADWLTRFAVMDPERAAQRVRFIDKYRSYVINYNLGLDLVRSYVEAQAGDDQARRWQVFEQLLSSPRLPSGLR